MLKQSAKAVLGLVGLQARQATLFHRALAVLCSDGHRPFFVQVGANNGVDFDDTYALSLKYQMTGLVIEPIRDYHDILAAVYRRHPGVIPVNAALHPTARSATLYRVVPECVCNDWEHGLASFSRDHLLAHGVPEASIAPEEVRCLNFRGLLDAYAPGAGVEVLIVDTEGFDGAILKMADEAGLRPKIIRFEAAHLPPEDLEQTLARLQRLDYVLATDGHDYIAVQPPLHSPIRYIRALLAESA